MHDHFDRHLPILTPDIALESRRWPAKIGTQLENRHMPTAVETTEPKRALTADFDIGPSAILNYSRLSYTLWYALAEFVDNTTQSRENYRERIDPVLESEGIPLKVEINYNPVEGSITIKDNSIGMTYDRLVAGLRIAHPTPDSRGRWRYGMATNTAACWLGN